MELQNLLNLSLDSLKEETVFNKYFGGMILEEGIEVTFFLNRELGIDLILDEDGIAKSIHFYSRYAQDISEFSDKLPFNLLFTSTREQTRAMFGVPDFTGGGGFSFLYGVVPAWDKYIIGNVFLHIQFTEDEKEISLLTLDRNPDQ